MLKDLTAHSCSPPICPLGVSRAYDFFNPFEACLNLFFFSVLCFLKNALPAPWDDAG